MVVNSHKQLLIQKTTQLKGKKPNTKDWVLYNEAFKKLKDRPKVLVVTGARRAAFSGQGTAQGGRA